MGSIPPIPILEKGHKAKNSIHSEGNLLEETLPVIPLGECPNAKRNNWKPSRGVSFSGYPFGVGVLRGNQRIPSTKDRPVIPGSHRCRALRVLRVGAPAMFLFGSARRRSLWVHLHGKTWKEALSQLAALSHPRANPPLLSCIRRYVPRREKKTTHVH